MWQGWTQKHGLYHQGLCMEEALVAHVDEKVRLPTLCPRHGLGIRYLSRQDVDAACACALAFLSNVVRGYRKEGRWRGLTQQLQLCRPQMLAFDGHAPWPWAHLLERDSPQEVVEGKVTCLRCREGGRFPYLSCEVDAAWQKHLLGER